MPNSMQLYDAEIKRKRDLLLLQNAADFPTIVKFWEKTRADFRSKGGWAEYKRPERENIHQNPATAHYREHAFAPWSNAQILTDMTVELSRFTVPKGSIGVVRKLFQWVEGYTDIDHWGDPVTQNAVVDGILWHLRLCNFTGASAPRLISDSPFLPGQPYPDLPFVRYLWFLPQAAGHDLNLVVPGGFSLRLIARIPARQQEDLNFLGRLVGYWQSSEYPLEASLNVKKGF